MATKTERAVIQVIINGDVANKSLRDLEAASRSLNAQMRKTEDPASRAKMAEQYRVIQKEVGGIKNEIKGVDTAWQSFMKNAKTIAAGVVGGNIITAVFQKVLEFIPNLIQKNAELADSFADVRKTTGLSASEMETLNKKLKQLDTRTSRKELLALATDAGRLGKESVEDIMKFVEQADKIKVALGEDLGENAITDIGKLSNIFKTESINIASAINEIADASEASGAYQVDFLKRMAGTAPTAKLAADEILGYGAALESLGQAQEVSATALNTFFLDFVSNTEKFGKTAGFAKGELKALLDEKGTNKAFVTFLENLKSGSKSSEDMIQKLQALGIDGARGANVMLTLANNTERVKKQQEIANAAIQNGNSITKEFEIRNQNLAGAVEKLGKKLSAIWSNSGLKNWLESILVSLADTRTEAKKLSDEFESQEAKSSNLTKKLEPLMKRYDELKTKTNLNKAEQDELKNVIGKIAAIVPSAISQVDKYGKALDINKSVVIKYTEAQQAMARVLNAKAIQEYNKEISDTEIKLQKVVDQMNANAKKRKAYEEENIRLGRAQWNAKSASYMEFENTQMQTQLALIEELKAKKSDLVVTRASLLGEDPNKYVAGKGTTSEGSAGGTGSGGGLSIEDQKKYNENTAKLLQELRTIQADAIKDEEQREYAAARARKDNRIKEINATVADAKTKNELIKALEEKYSTEVATISKKYNKKRTEDEYEQSLISSKDFFATKQEMLLVQLEEGIITREQYDSKVIDLEAQQNQALLTIANDYKDNLTKAEKDAIALRLKVLAESFDKEQRLREQNNRRSLAIAEMNIIASPQGTRARLNAETQYLQEQMRIELENTALTEEERLLIKQKYQEQFGEMQSEFNLAQAEQMVSIYMSVSSAVTEIMDQQAQHELDLMQQKFDKESELRDEAFNDQKSKIESTYDSEKAILDQQFKDRLISKTAYDNRLKALELKKNAALIQAEQDYNASKEQAQIEYEEKVRKIKTQQFVRDKIAKTIEAVINSALAVTSMLKYGPLAATAAGIAGAAQIAVIASQPTPVFRRGGAVGVPGPSHEGGGIDLIDSNSGAKVGEMEGGETYMIYSKQTTAQNRNLMDALLNSSLNANGSPVMPSMQSISTGAAIMRSGGIVNSPSGDSAGYSSQQYGNTDTLIKLAKVAEKLDKSVNDFADVISEGIVAEVSYDDLKEKVRKRRQIKMASSAGKHLRSEGFTFEGRVILDPDIL